ncbi:MAG TPA: hypothetical protein PLE50_11925, partial [Rhabdaerophilum sp.]|nr:hypothetical protein [Rhabdaerophilum sp.]
VGSADYDNEAIDGSFNVTIGLRQPGSTLEPGQIIASNSFGVAALARSVGADVLDLGIAPDRKDEIARRVRQAIAAGADVIVTL